MLQSSEPAKPFSKWPTRKAKQKKNNTNAATQRAKYES
jgi:hypothetical protein